MALHEFTTQQLQRILRGAIIGLEVGGRCSPGGPGSPEQLLAKIKAVKKELAMRRKDPSREPTGRKTTNAKRTAGGSRKR